MKQQAGLLLQLLALTLVMAGAIEEPDLSSCSTFALPADASSLTLEGGCFRLEEGLVALKQDLEIVGQADGSTVWDLQWQAARLALGGHTLKLTNITLATTLMMWEPPRELVPIFMDVHANGSRLSLEDVTFHLIGRCDNLQQVYDGFGNIATLSANKTLLFIPSSDRDQGKAHGSRITVQCAADGIGPQEIPFWVSDGPQLLNALMTFEQTRANNGIFSVTGANISLQDTDWPENPDNLPEVFNYVLVQGSQLQSVGRLPVIDFGLHPRIVKIQRGTAKIEFQHLILTNLHMRAWSDANARDPIALFSLSFHGFLTSDGEHVLVQNCTIVVTEFELKAFAYWGVLANTDGTPHIDRVAPYIQDLRLDRIRIFPMRDGTLLLREITDLRSVTFRNVTLTSEYPEQAPPRIRSVDENWEGDVPSIYTLENVPVVEAKNGSTFLQALRDTARDHQLLESDQRVLLSTPRVIYLTTDVFIQSQPREQALALRHAIEGLEGTTLAKNSSSANVTWPPERVVLQNGVILETIESQEDFHTISMGFVPELLEITERPLVLQYLNLVDIFAPCVRDDCEADSSGLKLLPAFFLWPIQFNRSEVELYVDSCTMALPEREFDSMLNMANAGTRWETKGGPLAAYFSSFQASSASRDLVGIQSFTGSGVQGTKVNITRHLCDTTECQLHEARAEDEDVAGVTPASPTEDNAEGKEDGGGNLAGILGPAIAVPVGVVLLSVLGVVLFFLIRRRRSDGPSAGEADVSRSEDGTLHHKHAISPSTLSSFHNPLADCQKHMPWHVRDEALNMFSVRSSSELPPSGESDPVEGVSQNEACPALHAVAGSQGSPSSYRIGSRAPSGRHLSMCINLSNGMPPEAAFGREQEQSPEDASEKPTSPLREIQQLVHQLKADHLVIQRQLGQGGFGTVYQGLWRALPVAVKVVIFSSKPVSPSATKRGAQDGGEAAMLEEALHALGQEHAILEAAVTSAIAHPNVVSTFHYDISEIKSEDVQGLRGLQVQANPYMKHWKLYLVQEFMEAGTLSDAIHRHRFFHSEDGLPFLDFVVQVLLDVAHGMAYVHSKSIIHGDLNPNNVLLRVDMSKLSNVCAKVADFGACHLLQQGRLHVSNVQVGTPFYMDPLIRATGRSSSASDVFSFGVIMWEMFRGYAPFTQTSSGHFVQASDYPRYPPGAPKVYEDLTLQCLSIKPAKRPSFSQCVAVLTGLQNSLATQA